MGYFSAKKYIEENQDEGGIFFPAPNVFPNS